MAMDWSGYGSYAAQPMEEVEDDEGEEVSSDDVDMTPGEGE